MNKNRTSVRMCVSVSGCVVKRRCKVEVVLRFTAQTSHDWLVCKGLTRSSRAGTYSTTTPHRKFPVTSVASTQSFHGRHRVQYFVRWPVARESLVNECLPWWCSGGPRRDLTSTSCVPSSWKKRQPLMCLSQIYRFLLVTGMKQLTLRTKRTENRETHRILS